MLSRKPRFLCVCCGHWTFENSPGARPPDTHAWSPWWPLPKEGAHVAGDEKEKDEEGASAWHREAVGGVDTVNVSLPRRLSRFAL